MGVAVSIWWNDVCSVSLERSVAGARGHGRAPAWVSQRRRQGAADHRGPLMATAPLIDRELEV